jgi:hypothetical protein
MSKSKFLTVILSVLPGLGHLYLGWMERGLQFMLSFLLAIFLMDSLDLTIFAYLLPVIWFYSLFDALQHFSNGHVAPEPPAIVSPWKWLAEKQRWIGFAMIAIGVIMIINRLALPWLHRYFTYEHIRMISSALVALLFIAGGIRLILGKRLPDEQEHEPADGSETPEGSEH